MKKEGITHGRPAESQMSNNEMRKYIMVQEGSLEVGMRQNAVSASHCHEHQIRRREILVEADLKCLPRGVKQCRGRSKELTKDNSQMTTAVDNAQQAQLCKANTKPLVAEKQIVKTSIGRDRDDIAMPEHLLLQLPDWHFTDPKWPAVVIDPVQMQLCLRWKQCCVVQKKRSSSSSRRKWCGWGGRSPPINQIRMKCIFKIEIRILPINLECALSHKREIKDKNNAPNTIWVSSTIEGGRMTRPAKNATMRRARFSWRRRGANETIKLCLSIKWKELLMGRRLVKKMMRLSRSGGRGRRRKERKNKQAKQ